MTTVTEMTSPFGAGDAIPAADPLVPEPRRGLGLSGRLLALTMVFVMLAAVMIFVPSIASFRRMWLNDRIAAAQIAALVVEAAPEGMVPPELIDRILNGIGARAVAIRVDGHRRILASGQAPPRFDRIADMREPRQLVLMRDAAATLLLPAREPILVIGNTVEVADPLEIAMDEAPLRAAMLSASLNLFLTSLVISVVTAGLLYVTLMRLIVRPVRRLAAAAAAFERDPERPFLTPSSRADEIGHAERAISRMQSSLADALREKSRLAALGLAVSKVNHDLRNMLSTAQIMSDRLSQLPDENVQRFAPRLIATLDRAIAFCHATLAYGRAAEPRPRREQVTLRPLVEDMAASLRGDAQRPFDIHIDVPETVRVDADPSQLLRVLDNIGRNAAEAVKAAAASGSLGDERGWVRVSASRSATMTVIRIADNGPGLSAQVRERLFEPFRGGGRPGGTGLGLAIAAELVRLHGGEIAFETVARGASVRLTIPDR